MVIGETARTERLITELFEWWIGRGVDQDLAGRLQAHAVYDGGMPRLTIDEFIWRAQEGAVLEDVRLVAIIAHDDKGALMYECRDPVTGLRHRVAWFIETRDGDIASIREVIGRIT